MSKQLTDFIGEVHQHHWLSIWEYLITVLLIYHQFKKSNHIIKSFFWNDKIQRFKIWVLELFCFTPISFRFDSNSSLAIDDSGSRKSRFLTRHQLKNLNIIDSLPEIFAEFAVSCSKYYLFALNFDKKWISNITMAPNNRIIQLLFKIINLLNKQWIKK